MSDVQVGQVLSEAQPRDAIHMAVASVIADCNLMPGNHVGFVPGSSEHVSTTAAVNIGIVDPFLPVRIYTGERFWLFLYPRTVTTLRHAWEHPAFPGEQPVLTDTTVSRMWLEDLAGEVGMSYERLLAGIADGRIHTGDREMYGCRNEEDVKRHYSIVTGNEPPDSVYFSCAC